MDDNQKDWFVANVASDVVKSPVTGNACHAITWPSNCGCCLVNDLDMGVTYYVKVHQLEIAEKFRSVEKQDFEFSWVIDKYDEELRDWALDRVE